MVFDPVTKKQRKQFFKQCYGAHVPGYTGHCPTLKFQVGQRFGASTEEIMKELLEKKVLKVGPYRPNSGDVLIPTTCEQDIRRDCYNQNHLYKRPPFILGYTGYIPGFNNKYGLPFMRAVEEGEREWRQMQRKLKAQKDIVRSHIERNNPRNLLSRARKDNVDIEIDHGYTGETIIFDNQVSPEKPPIVGYTGHIPGAKSEIALSRRYAQAARKGLELLQKERINRNSLMNDTHSMQQFLDATGLDDIGCIKA